MAEEETPEEALEVAAVRVELRENGPIVIIGAVELDNGTSTERAERLFLCRCGNSENKPLCDGSHKRSGFIAGGRKPPQRP